MSDIYESFRSAEPDLYELYVKEFTSQLIAQRKDEDICLSTDKNGGTWWSNKEDIRRKCKIFYKLRKSGFLTLSEDNNRKIKMDGKTFYYFVVQHTNEDTDTFEDTFAESQGMTVKGRVYFFTRRSNRDDLYNYIMSK